MRINSFVFGLMAGVGIGYLLSTRDKEEIIEGLESTAKIAKNLINDGMKKGKNVTAKMKSVAEDFENE